MANLKLAFMFREQKEMKNMSALLLDANRTYLASSMQINIDATECECIVHRLSNSALHSLYTFFPFVFKSATRN